jgi:hypothetical protein
LPGSVAGGRRRVSTRPDWALEPFSPRPCPRRCPGRVDRCWDVVPPWVTALCRRPSWCALLGPTDARTAPADVMLIWLADVGVWSLDIRHDGSCPTLTGGISRVDPLVTALRNAQLEARYYIEVDLSG